MKQLLILITLFISSYTAQSRSLYCISLDAGQMHCYIDGRPCRGNLPANVSCENLNELVVKKWNPFVLSSFANSTETVSVEAFDGKIISLLNITNEVIGHANWVYTVTYSNVTDKVLIKINYNDNSTDVLEAINNPTGVITKEFQNVAQIRAGGSTTVSPNPFITTANFRIKYDNLPVNATILLKIYKITGEAIYSKNGISNNSVHQVTNADIKENGSYVFKVFYSNLAISTGTVIKN